jgi:hypothetical protein
VLLVSTLELVSNPHVEIVPHGSNSSSVVDKFFEYFGKNFHEKSCDYVVNYCKAIYDLKILSAQP